MNEDKIKEAIRKQIDEEKMKKYALRQKWLKTTFIGRLQVLSYYAISSVSVTVFLAILVKLFLFIINIKF